jgi:serine/threonine protein kinase/WD40 repeat protein
MQRSQTDSAEQDEPLGEAIEEYLDLAESGQPPDPEEFASRYPEIADELLEALKGFSLVRGLVGAPGDMGRRLEAGRRLAGYRIVRELGSGGMGVVYEAVHVDLDRPVALKVLDARFTRDGNGLRRFQEEAKLAAGLHHTHIVPVFDVGNVGGLCYYAMQRIEGTGLDRVLKTMRRDRSTGAGSGSVRHPVVGSAVSPPNWDDSAPGSISWPAASGSVPAAAPGSSRRDEEHPCFVPPRGSAYYRWVAEAGRQAAQALAHAHRRGVIHRDVKPSNLLVDLRGTIWVTDFGLARRLSDPGLTRSDSLLGTPRYMSPEQTKSGTLDGRTDVYSLGATLYELLTLRPPFEGRTAAELVQQIGDRDPVPPRKVDPRIPRDLETIVLKAMAKRSADRFLDASELADDLGRFLGHEPVQARRIGPIGRLWRLARRHPAVAVVSTAASIAVVTTMTIAYVRVVQERNLARNSDRTAREALRESEANRAALKRTMLEDLLGSAALVRASHVPNLRERGLAQLTQAVALQPAPAIRARLRDEAVQFLALRDLEARRELATGGISGLVFGPAGGRLAILSRDKQRLSLWDVARREPQGRPADTGPDLDEPNDDENAPLRRFVPPSFDPQLATTGTLTAVIWPTREGIRVFDTSDRTMVTDIALPGRDVRGLYGASSASGLRLVTAEVARASEDDFPMPMRESPQVVLRDLLHPEAPIATLADARSRSRESRGFARPLVAVSPDGETIATAWANDTTVLIHASSDGRKLGEIEIGTPLSALALGPDNVLAAAGVGAVRLWHVASKPKPTPGLVVQPQHNVVTTLRFSPNGMLLAMARAGRSDVEVWDPASNVLVAALPTVEEVSDLAFDPLGQRLAVAQVSSVSLWAVVESAVRTRVSNLPARPHSLAFGPGGMLGVTFLFGPPVRFWDPTRCPTTAHDREELRATALASDGRNWFAATGSALHRWTGSGAVDASARLASPDERPRARAQAITTTPNGQVVAMARGGEVFLWRAEDPARLVPIHPAAVRGRTGSRPLAPMPPWWSNLALAPSGRRLFLTLFPSKEVQVWDLKGASGEVERVDWAIPYEVLSLALAPDGTTLALADPSGNLHVLDAATGAERGRVAAGPDDGNEVQAMAFSPDSRILAVGTQQGVVHLWAVSRGGDPLKSLVRLPGHRGAVVTLAYDGTGTHLASGGDDKAVDVWDLARLQRELTKIGLQW